MQSILPIDATRLDHPLARHYRAHAVQTGPGPLLGELDIPGNFLISRWLPYEPKLQDVFIYGEGTKPQLISLTDDPNRDASYGYAWDACTAHLSFRSIAANPWLLCLSRDACLFLKSSPADPDRPVSPQRCGQARLREMTALADRDELLLPFVPVREGRFSAHADIATRRALPGQIRRILMMLLPGSVEVRDPNLPRTR